MRFFNYLFFLMAPNFLALATTLENLGARWLLAKKVNFVPCSCDSGWTKTFLIWFMVAPDSFYKLLPMLVLRIK